MIKIPVSEHTKIASMYQSGKLLIEIASEYSVSRETIAKILRKQDIKIQHPHKRKSEKGVVLNYFEKESEGRSYFYGFLLADGCISDRGKVNLGLEFSDGYLLECLKEELGLSNSNVNHIVRKSDGRKYATLCFKVDAITKSLTSLGLTPRKSLKEIAPDCFLNDRHFWRGMVDGDGSISKTTSRVYLCGSLTICQQFLEFCKTIDPTISTKPSLSKGLLHRITICGVKASRVLNELYKDSSFFLKRKKDCSERIIAKYEVDP